MESATAGPDRPLAAVPEEPDMSQPFPPAEGTAWAPPQPSWAPSWQPPPPPSVVPGPPIAGHPAPGRRKDVPLLVLAAVVGLLVGIVGTGLVGMAVLAGGAAGIGEVIADEVRGAMEEGVLSEEYAASGPVEEFPPTPPGDLGPDPVLNAYAQGCFTGDLQACDDLYSTSPPLSDYEEYAAACGGRVKPYALMFCTELE
jgi:hypothetical protein